MKERKRPSDEQVEELFEPPDVDAIYASVTTSIKNAVIACRRVAPKENCNGLEVTQAVSEAVTLKQKQTDEAGPRNANDTNPERSAPPMPQRKPE